jgi:hypothetical protein
VHPNYLGVKNPFFSGMNPKYNIIPLGRSCGMVYWLLSTYQLGVTSKHVTHPPYVFFCNAQAGAECGFYGNCFAAIMEN